MSRRAQLGGDCDRSSAPIEPHSADKSTLTLLEACSGSVEPLSVLSCDRHPAQMLGDARAKVQPVN
eukprot:5879040-Alexandrium_andersonii.AAC.1